MCTSISRRLPNIYFPQLAIYITALLNYISPISKSKAAARGAALRNAGEILMRTDYKVSSMPHEQDLLGICWLSTFHLTNSVQKLLVQFFMHVGNTSFLE